jgi:hypothetical protein
MDNMRRYEVQLRNNDLLEICCENSWVEHSRYTAFPGWGAILTDEIVLIRNLNDQPSPYSFTVTTDSATWHDEDGSAYIWPANVTGGCGGRDVSD